MVLASWWGPSVKQHAKALEAVALVPVLPPAVA